MQLSNCGACGDRGHREWEGRPLCLGCYHGLRYGNTRPAVLEILAAASRKGRGRIRPHG